MKKYSLLLFLLSPLLSNTATAGEYSLSGFITEIKVNIQGGVCNIDLSDGPKGKHVQGGVWDCNSTIGQNLLDIARVAKALNLHVDVVFEGDGSTNKPVYSIRILNN